MNDEPQDHGLPPNWPEPLGWLEAFRWDEAWHPQYIDGVRNGISRFDGLIPDWWNIDINAVRSAEPEFDIVDLRKLIGGDDLEEILGVDLSAHHLHAFELGLGPWKFHLMAGQGSDLSVQLVSLWTREIEWRQGMIRLGEPLTARWGPLDDDDVAGPREQSCPRCGSARVMKIVYGMPTPPMWEQAEKKQVHLGGCVVMGDPPRWHCDHCGGQWTKRSEVKDDDGWPSRGKWRPKPLRLLGRALAEGPVRERYEATGGWVHYVDPSRER